MGSLCDLVMRMRDRDAEAVEFSLKLLTRFFRTRASLDQNRGEPPPHLSAIARDGAPTAVRSRVNAALFFGKAMGTADLEAGDTSVRCLKMLRDPAALLRDAKTHLTQLALVDLLVALGPKGSPFRKPVFAPFCERDLRHDSTSDTKGDFERQARRMLQGFNDHHDTHITSCVATEVRHPDSPSVAEPSVAVHFQATILKVESARSFEIKFTSVASASLSLAALLDSAPPLHELKISFAGEDGAPTLIRLLLDEPSLAQLRTRRAFERLPTLTEQREPAVQGQTSGQQAGGRSSRSGTASAVGAASSAGRAGTSATKVAKGSSKKASAVTSAAAVREQVSSAEDERQRVFEAARAQQQARTVQPTQEDDDSDDDSDTADGRDERAADDGGNEDETAADLMGQEDHAAVEVTGDAEDDDSDGTEGSDDEYVPSQPAIAGVEVPSKASAKQSKSPTSKEPAASKPNAAKKVPAVSKAPAKQGKAPQGTATRSRGLDIFVDAKRPGLQRQHPQATAGELRKVLAEKWKRMDASERAPW